MRNRPSDSAAQLREALELIATHFGHENEGEGAEAALFWSTWTCAGVRIFSEEFWSFLFSFLHRCQQSFYICAS